MSISKEDDEYLFFEINGKEHCDEEGILAILLREEILFANSLDYLDNEGQKAGHTLALFVNCNDLFYWGCADCEDIHYGEIANLYKAVRDDPKHGSSKWCCRRRGMQPQYPIRERWKKEGIWDEEMESLQVPGPS